MNNVTISGNLTREPEVKGFDGSEYSVITFSIANNDERKKEQTGQYTNVASFLDCEYWTKNPQHWMKQLYKGTPVVLQGRLKQDRWDDNGTTKSRIKIIVQQYPMVLAGKSEHKEEESKPPVSGPEQFDDDQIPF